ncbi:MAG TPA: fibronectin type III domain-containing protein, partial [Candidatus Limnocylindrales bacterium]
AERMAVTGLLSHEVGGDLASAIAGTGVRWFKVAENIGRTDAAWGEDSVDWLYRHWRGSAEHWQIMLDDSLNYVGVGLALSADGSTYASMVFAETADRTSPTAAMTSARLDDRTATFEWSGTEVALPTHTAGLLGFDVQCRVDAGPWRWIRVGTTTTSIELRNRTAGHGYSVRVRARDRAGNTSNWSVPLRVFIR